MSQGTWPEQDAIIEWLDRHGLDFSPRETLDLKEAVTAPRIAEQKRADIAEAECVRLRQKVDELENQVPPKGWVTVPREIPAKLVVPLAEKRMDLNCTELGLYRWLINGAAAPKPEDGE